MHVRSVAQTESQAQVLPVTLESLREHRILFLAQPRLDEFIGGFFSSEMALIDSANRFVFDLTSVLCVEATTAFREELIFVDGGNSIDPYGIANLCKRKGYDRQEVLSQINCARAFTAYQLVNLINDKLEDMVRNSRSSTLIVSSFVDLFFDKDMPWQESFQLIRRCVNTLKRLTKEHNLITILTNHGLAKLHFRRGLRHLMYNAPDALIRIEDRKKGLKVILPREERFIYFYPVPTYQTILEEFFLGERYVNSQLRLIPNERVYIRGSPIKNATQTGGP
jgi:hypothetical protein